MNLRKEASGGWKISLNGIRRLRFVIISKQFQYHQTIFVPPKPFLYLQKSQPPDATLKVDQSFYTSTPGATSHEYFNQLFSDHLFINGTIRECIFSTWGNSRVRLFLSTSWFIPVPHEWPKATSDREMNQRVLRQSLNPRIASSGKGIL